MASSHVAGGEQEEETVYFLYGSETGNCESIAKRLHHLATTDKGYPAAECMTLNQAVTKKLLDKQFVPEAEAERAVKEKRKICLVMVCSTTGDGEPPENAARFRRWLRNARDGKLVNVRFSMLALGDTNYNNFCAAGKHLDSKISELGGVRFYPRGEADDGVGLELVVDPWTEGVWDALAAKGDHDAPAPVVGHETYQAGGPRVDMAVALETAIVYANASQICATVALFMYERIQELGGAADLYPLQYFAPEKLKREATIVLFVVCTDSDELTLCEHCAAEPRQAPLGAFAELLLCPGVGAGQPPSGATAALNKWLADPSLRLFCSVCVVPKQESLPQATNLSRRITALMASNKLEKLNKRLTDEQSSAVAVSEDDVCSWAEAVLDNLPGVTADVSEIRAAVVRFFDTRVGAAFRDAYAADAGLLSAVDSTSGVISGVEGGGGGEASGCSNKVDDVMRFGGCGGHAPSVDSRRSAAAVAAACGGRSTAYRLQQLGRLRRHHQHYHEHFSSAASNGNGSCVSSPATAGGVMKEDTESCSTGFANSVESPSPLARSHATVTVTTGGVAKPSRRAGGNRDAFPKDTKLLNEYNLTPVVFLYSGGEFVSQVAHDINAGAAAHHLRSSVADLSNFGHAGFPRRATFVFVLGGVVTKAMAKLFKLLRSMGNEDRSIAGVKFAVLGIDETSQSEKFNVCALELETLLLAVSASKIHCTGLADMDNPDTLQPVLNAWTMNLWSAIIYPTASMAYLDAASPNICAGNVLQLPLYPDSPQAIFQQASSTSSGTYGGTAAAKATSASVATGAVVVAASAGDMMFADAASAILVDEHDPRHSSGSSRTQTISRTGAGGSNSAGVNANSSLNKSTTVSAAGVLASSTAPLFPWDSVPLSRDNAAVTPLVFLYSSSGMAKTVAVHAAAAAKTQGFPTAVHPFAHFDRVDYTLAPNMVLFCESGADGQSTGGKRFRKFLLSPSHSPDFLSQVRFAVLGLAPSPAGVAHPAFAWSNMLSRLQASRVFPVVIMPSLSQLHSLGMPWCDCVFATLALAPPPRLASLSSALVSNAVTPSQQHQTGLKKMSVLFLYGSATGLAEAIARELHASALEVGYASRIATLNSFERMNFVSTDNIVIVCSTVASNTGGYPDNARRFAKYIHRKSQPANLLNGASARFAVLGADNGFGELRDERGNPVPVTTATATAEGENSGRIAAIAAVGVNGEERKDRFCRSAKRIDKRLEELGGNRLCPVGCVDASMILAEPVGAWRVQLFNALRVREAELAKEAGVSLGPPSTDDTVGSNLNNRNNASAATVATAAGGPSANCGPTDQNNLMNSTATVTSSANRNLEANVVKVAATAPRELKVLVAYASPPKSAVPSIATHLEKTIRESTPMAVSVQTMNALTQTEWRNDHQVLVLVLVSSEDGDFPLNGSAFLRLLRQKNNPLDLFAQVRYTVLAISDTNERRFSAGRSVDRRLEELGGTRFFARGEVVDSFSLEKSLERWIAGLLSTLTSFHESVMEAAVAHRPVADTEVSNWAAAAAFFTGEAGSPLKIAVPQQPETATETISVAAGEGNELSRRLHSRPHSDVSSESGTGTFAGRTGFQSDTQDCDDDRGGTATSVASNVDVLDHLSTDVGEGILHSWKRLTADCVEEPVVLINLSVNPETTHWQPGQTVAVMPTNDPALVGKLLERLGVRPDEAFHPLNIARNESSSFPNAPLYATVDFPVCCSTVLLRYVLLRLSKGSSSSTPLFAVLEKSTTSQEEKVRLAELLASLSTSASGGAPVTLLDALNACPSARPSFRHVVEHLPILQPRTYSIASAAADNPKLLSLCFKVVRHGLCTNWMYDLCRWTDSAEPSTSHPTVSTSARQQNELVLCRRRAALRFTIRAVGDFRMPRDAMIPLILVGPGTGISPFRAFLQERAAWLQQRRCRGSSDTHTDKDNVQGIDEEADGVADGRKVNDHVPRGGMDLYFGCRRAAEDFLFDDELEKYEKTGVLNSLNVAFSREANGGAFWYGGCYVQDTLTASGVGIAELITQRGARVYVCGDADAMAKDVHQCLIDIVQQHLCVTMTEAVEYVDNMMKSGRYIRDIWTISFP